MTTKEFLNMAYMLDKRINAKQKEVDSLRSLAYGVSSPSFEERYKSTKNTNAPYVHYVEKIMAMEDAINSEIDSLVDLKAEIGAAIAGVKDINQCLVLRYRYIECMTWKQVSAALCIDERTARRWHKKAIDKVVVPEKYKDK